MIKVTPFFPLSTKQKCTNTMTNFNPNNYSDYAMSNNYKQTCTSFCQKMHINIQRIQQLSKPKRQKLQTTNNLLSCSSTFFNNKKYKLNPSLKMNKILFENNLSKSINFTANQTQSRTQSKQNQSFVKYPKISPKTLNRQYFQQKQLNQNLWKKQSTSKSLKKSQLTGPQIFLSKNRKLKEDKKSHSYIDLLKSSDLSSVYNNLYNLYQKIPFNQLEQTQPILLNILQGIKKQSQQNQNEKYALKKQIRTFELKKLEKQINLRKQIKSLTRDTDHILSLEFRDIRDVNNNR